MYSNIILLCISILPVILLGSYVYYKDRFEKEPFKMLLKALICGCLSVIPAMFMEAILTSTYSFSGSGVIEGLYTGYVVAGCSEELCKLLLLTIAVWKSRYFDEYFDGIVYATFVSLGFAGLENIMYVFGQADFGSSLTTGTMRALLAVPGHFLFGVVMGYYFALAKFQPEKRFGNFVKAFIYPMLLHGTYDSLLMVPEALGFAGPLVSLGFFVLFIYFDIRLWKIGIRRLKEMQLLNEIQYDEAQNNYSNHYDDTDNSYGGNSGYGNSTDVQDPFSGFNWNV